MPEQALCRRPGKTTFIKHLLGREYPGIHIGPEPTTDRFVIVDHALEERRTPGNTLIVQPDKPYQVLARTMVCSLLELQKFAHCAAQ